MEIKDLCYEISLNTLKQVFRDKKNLAIEYFTLFDNENEEKYWPGFSSDFYEFYMVLWLGDKPFPYSRIPREKLDFLLEDIINFLKMWT